MALRAVGVASRAEYNLVHVVIYRMASANISLESVVNLFQLNLISHYLSISQEVIWAWKGVFSQVGLQNGLSSL